jgi:hypothetical protein
MNPHDVVSPISLPATDLDHFRKAWVLYLEREGIKGDHQPTVDDVEDFCTAMGIAVDEPSPPPPQAPSPLLPTKKKPAATTLTPEQEAILATPWTEDERREFQAWCRSQAKNFVTVEGKVSAAWLRRKRGLPPRPEPPPEPMRWEKGQYGGMKGIHEQRANDGGSFGGGFRRPGTSQHP